MSRYPNSQINANDIAIVGMAARVPGARNVRELWRNIRDGVESVRAFTDEELLAQGVTADHIQSSRYVKSGAVLEEMEGFDAEFFGFSPKEAAIMDPQHRHFLECAWEALEDSGHPPETFQGPIAVYAGCGMGAYFIYNLLSNPDLVESVGLFLLRHTGNDKDFLATRVSYLFNLTGPSINVQTACSTSMVATHMACQSLLNGECDMALAGGVTIEIPHYRGYHYTEGEILSPDGHCRAFDHRSQGTIFGSGAGVVVLRRAKDAIEDGDFIHAIWKGSAVNNDGAGKVGYLAPSVDGQAAAMAEALALAGVSADSIRLVECHGTGTYVGDPIEVAALTQAFQQSTSRKDYCGIGSIKTNIGHLDTAAGVASLIKATLSLQNKQMPPSLNFEAPNPTIDFRSSPFFVNNRLREWPEGAEPRRAAVNSLGVGGTNAFAIIEEAPQATPSSISKKPFQLLTLSARNRTSLDAYMKKLASFLRECPEVSLADVAYTLHVGRRGFDQRRVLACRDREEAIAILESNDPRRIFTQKVTTGAKPSVVFMFPGGGAQYPNMGRDLYESEPLFRELVDHGLELLQPKVDFNVRQVLFPPNDQFEAAAKELQRPGVQLAPIFIIEYALAKLWMSWGVQPEALIGHSLGENTAACVAGVLSFEDALGLVTLRGQLFERVPAGGMVSVPLPANQLLPLLGDKLDLATVNSPEFCVASGRTHDLDELQRTLAERGVDAKRIPISIAAHSRLLEPILADFGAYLRSIQLNAPHIPFISNRTGTWITNEQATDPDYWVQHLRHTIHFGDGIGTLLQTPGRVIIEVGPGKTLSSLAKQHPSMKPGQGVLSSMRHPEEKVSDAAYFLTALGQAWATGIPFDLTKLWEGETRQRIPLPTYAFQHQKYWIEPGKVTTETREDVSAVKRIADFEDWFYRPVWKRGEAESRVDEPSGVTTLLFMDDAGIGERLAERLRKRGHEVLLVRESDGYHQTNPTEFYLSPEQGREGYDHLVRDFVNLGKMPSRVIHLWLVTANEGFRPGSSFFHRNQERGFYSLFFLAQAMADEGVRGPRQITVVSNGMQQVENEPLPYPDKSTVLGPCKVIPREIPGYTCTTIDLALPQGSRRRWGGGKAAPGDLDKLVNLLEAECLSKPGNDVAAYRDGQRWVQQYERSRLLPPENKRAPKLRNGGVYLITGGLGGIGLAVAGHFAETVQAKLVLISRSGLPPKKEWDVWEKRNGTSNGLSEKIRSVRALESKGAEVLVAAADVTDVEAMRRVIAETRERFGRLDGVIHAAGTLNDGLIQTKSQAEIEEVFAPKIQGTLVLDSLLRDADLDFFVLFSSTSTVLGPPGQVDYVAANAFLNAFAQHRNGQDRANTVAVNWGVWNEVGMAAEASSRMGKHGSAESLSEEPTRHPLYTSRSSDGKGLTVLRATYHPATHWILHEHRTKAGTALMPGTGFIEMARAALAECGETGTFEIADLFFFRPLAVSDDEPKEVRVRLRRNDAGYHFEVHSKCVLDDGRVGWEAHTQAKLLLHALPPVKPLSLSAIDARCQVKRLAEDKNGMRSKQEDFLRFGPRWRVLRQVCYGQGEAYAKLELPESFEEDLKDFQLHPALLDFATGFATDLIEGYEKDRALWVPVSYKSIRVHGPLTRKLTSWIRNHGENRADKEFVALDIVIADPQGRVLIEVEEFAMKRVSGEVDFAVARRPLASEMELESSPGTDNHQLSPAERAFRHNLRHGIGPAEGTAALTRILSHGDSPQIIVTSLDLDGLVRQVDTISSQTERSSTKFDRPALDSEYVEPRDDIERTLVGFWEELLGVKSVGIRDSFFDLGGHSLIAVRLFAKIKKAFQVEYPISVLFEAPNVERCADLIRAAVGDTGAKRPVVAESQERRYKHLVPMHPKDPGVKTPFFLIAGMFGNVLNLRHLAHLIGTERPFYGVQARGLYGDDLPHESFTEMAGDYLAEIRSVQPHGPYLLGGFSGGGIAAYEITQQLLEEGETVSLLVLLDTPLPQSPPLSATDKTRIHWQRLKRQGPSYLTNWARDRIAWELKKRNGKHENGQGEMHPTEFRSEAIKDAFYRALPKYEVQRYAGTITLFRPKLDSAYVLGPGRILNSSREFVYPDNGWGPFADRVEVHEVPGDHDSMVLEPNVRVMAHRLRACLQKAELACAAPNPSREFAGAIT
ncbi:MAG: SDR family NAD(P)-dependent oxidoreductase [Planctomycetota bacterium]